MFRIVVALVFVMLGGMVFVGCREDSGGGERREDGNGDAFLVGFAEVRDGDSFLLGGEEVRLLGIDAPEYDQECGEGEDIWRCQNAELLHRPCISAAMPAQQQRALFR